MREESGTVDRDRAAISRRGHTKPNFVDYTPTRVNYEIRQKLSLSITFNKEHRRSVHLPAPNEPVHQSHDRDSAEHHHIPVHCCNYLQTDWVEWLPIAEFAINAHPLSTTNVSPFVAVYGYQPRFGIEPLELEHKQPVSARAFTEIQNCDSFIKQMSDLHAHLKDEILYAQAHYAKYDSGRSPSPAYQVGDKVWLNSKNLRTNRPSKKLDLKNLDPFKITEIINPRAYRLRLPIDMRIHNVFHTSLLQPNTDLDPLPGQVQPTSPPIVIERREGTQEEYEVEEVRDSRLYRKKTLQYLVKWKGYENADWRYWTEVLPDCDEITRHFQLAHPRKPGPPKDYIFDLNNSE